MTEGNYHTNTPVTKEGDICGGGGLRAEFPIGVISFGLLCFQLSSLVSYGLSLDLVSLYLGFTSRLISEFPTD
jgi:hypothetical protein